MAIDFPSSPTPGQPYTSGGMTWVWDGVKWNSANTGAGLYLPLSGGTMTGDIALKGDPTALLHPATKQYSDTKLAKLGVIDGSNAAAGQIGEFLQVDKMSGPVSLVSTVVKSIVSLSLTAGDWDVDGTADVVFSTGGQAAFTAVSLSATVFPATTYAGTGGVTLIAGTALAEGMSATSLSRVSIAATTTVYLVAQAIFPSGTATGLGSLRARRMR